MALLHAKALLSHTFEEAYTKIIGGEWLPGTKRHKVMLLTWENEQARHENHQPLQGTPPIALDDPELTEAIAREYYLAVKRAGYFTDAYDDPITVGEEVDLDDTELDGVALEDIDTPEELAAVPLLKSLFDKAIATLEKKQTKHTRIKVPAFEYEGRTVTISITVR